MSDITKDQVVEWLSGQSVLEIELVKELEEKWGVSAAAPVAAVAALLPLAEMEVVKPLLRKTSLISKLQALTPQRKLR